MGVGHVALALGASKAVPRLNVGWLVFAALLADFLLGIFVAFGLEHATAPPDFASRHYLLFTFPYSHGLVALLAWAAILGFFISRGHGADRRRLFIVVALVVLSHFFLDGLVHVRGLPLIGENSPKLGLALWNHMPSELALETLMAIAGVAIYWKLSGAHTSAACRYGMAGFVGLVTAMTWSQLFAPAPPTPGQAKIAWLVTPLILSAIPYALDRRRVRQAAPES